MHAIFQAVSALYEHVAGEPMKINVDTSNGVVAITSRVDPLAVPPGAVPVVPTSYSLAQRTTHP